MPNLRPFEVKKIVAYETPDMRPWIPELPSRDYVDLSPGLLGDQNKCILLLLGII